MLTKSISFHLPFFLLLCIPSLFFFAPSTYAAELELNTVLMESTFKIQGAGVIGTVFVLGLPSKKNPKEAYYVMVTAAHVLDSIKDDTAQLVLRRKKPDGTFERQPFPVSIRKKGKPLWVRHPDKDVDVAAMYLPLPSFVGIPLLPTFFLADDKVFQDFEIHPGDELLCLGYPLNAEGPSGFPILRSGRIASYSLLPSKATKGFLYDFRVFQGNSGGPVYFVESNRGYKGSIHVGTIQFIAGLVSQEFQVAEITKSLYKIEQQTYPLSLAKVVPAVFIKETIALLPPMK